MFIRNSVLRRKGVRPIQSIIANARIRNAVAAASTFRDGLSAVAEITGSVNTPNGTTRKIARVVNEALA